MVGNRGIGRRSIKNLDMIHGLVVFFHHADIRENCCIDADI